MTPPSTLFHALLRPSVLQILRASGYHCTRPAVLDSLTELAAQYLSALCRRAAVSAGNIDADVDVDIDGTVPLPGVPSLVDVRVALEECGALGSDLGEDDVTGVQELVDWFMGPKNAEIKRVALDGEEEATDWLGALKQKHSKTGEDSKFQGTLLGKGNEHGEILVEGGAFDSIQSWAEHMKKTGVFTPPPSPSPPPPSGQQGPDDDLDSRPPSSGLSSLGDRSIGEDMDFEMGIGVGAKGDVDMRS